MKVVGNEAQTYWQQQALKWERWVNDPSRLV